jgi:hypothetical protein
VRAGVGPVERLDRRNDVEDGKALDSVRVIERQTIGHPPSPIVAGNGEPRESELLHDPDHVDSQLALRVGPVIRPRGWLAARPIAAQVGADDRVAVRKPRRYAVPHQVRLGKSVEEQYRWPGTRPSHVDVTAAGRNQLAIEGLEHR